MNESKLRGRLLTHLYRRRQNNEIIDIIGLSEACGVSVFAALKALAALERAGLCDARRLRLTLPGLALAAAFSGAPLSEGKSQPPVLERRPGASLPKARHAA